MFHSFVFPLSLAQAKSTAAKLKALGIHHVDVDDVMQEAWLLQHANPELCDSNLIAILINQSKQSRRRSIIANFELHPDFDLVDELNDDSHIEKWRWASDDELAAMGWSVDPTKLRSALMATGHIGDRRARQLLQAAIRKLDAGQSDLFTNQIGE
jgi:hypothetical protein